MTIELSEYVIDAIADAVVRKMGKPCDDAVDRAEAMTEIMMYAGNVKSDEEDIYIKVSDAVQLLRELPPVTSKPKMGRWVKTPKAIMGEGYMWYCDKCSHEVYQDSSRSYPSEKFCPNCGQPKMQEV